MTCPGSGAKPSAGILGNNLIEAKAKQIYISQDPDLMSQWCFGNNPCLVPEKRLFLVINFDSVPYPYNIFQSVRILWGTSKMFKLAFSAAQIQDS